MSARAAVKLNVAYQLIVYVIKAEKVYPSAQASGGPKTINEIQIGLVFSELNVEHHTGP